MQLEQSVLGPKFWLQPRSYHQLPSCECTRQQWAPESLSKARKTSPQLGSLSLVTEAYSKAPCLSAFVPHFAVFANLLRRIPILLVILKLFLLVMLKLDLLAIAVNIILNLILLAILLVILKLVLRGG